MNEEIEYAEMLEIPVSTVNIVRKNQRRKKIKAHRHTTENTELFATELPAPPLKDSVIAQVNNRLNDDEDSTEQTIRQEDFSEENTGEGSLDERLNFDPAFERVDTTRLYSSEETGGWKNSIFNQPYDQENQNKGGRYALNYKKDKNSPFKIVLNTEFVAVCALCGAIFLTNVFMPNSAINTFFRSIHSATAMAQTDTRQYSDFTLSPVISELSSAELSLSPAGILSFTEACCVYPAANGTVSSVVQNSDGSYTVKITHSDTFPGVFNGLDFVYYSVGDEVKANVPLGYSNGENEVQVTMYSGGVLLNCFQLTEENCLTWVEAAQ